MSGDADECHPCIGYARRIMVPRREQQADILVQAVQNHNPDVIIVDEIGTKQVGATLTTQRHCRLVPVLLDQCCDGRGLVVHMIGAVCHACLVMLLVP